MDEHSLKIYVHEIISQAKNVYFAGELYKEGLKNQDNAKMFFAVQSHLGAAAIISKILWPDPRDGNRAVRRGEKLRELLLAEERVYLLKDKSVRNGFEHIDRRLDSYLASNATVFIRTVASAGQIRINGEDPKYLQRIDDVTHTVSIMDKEINLNSLNEEVQEIYDRAYECQIKYGWQFS